jgi:5S rRNA maturation endonuclease (ribonuclease M5)
MLKDEYKLWKDLQEIIREMNDEVDAVIVEGAHDKRTLEKMGFEKPILKYSESRKSDVDFIDFIAARYKRIAILTDYDRSGSFYNRKLSLQLERKGVRVERIFRRKIKEKLQVSGMRTIEAIYSLTRKLFS